MSGGSAFCIEIGIRPERTDVAADRLAGEAAEQGLPLPAGVRTRRGYSLRTGGEEQARTLAERLLADPVLNTLRLFRSDQDPREPGSVRLEVVRLPGVMDPAAQSIERAGRALGLDVRDVRSWQAWVFPGSVDPDLVRQVGHQILANAAIEEVRVEPPRGIPPRAELSPAIFELVHVPLRGAARERLVELSARGCLALDATEMEAVREHFGREGREPTDIELETLAQTWSEHCKHKTMTGKIDFEGQVIDNLLKSTIARATRELDRPFCKSVFVDNAGVVAFDERFHLTFKVETHNHPSAIEPYGGAGTGLGGVLRDTLGTGLGARPVASTDVFCFGPPDLPAEKLPKGCLHPLRVMKGVVAGVRDYGNRMGIPTVNGAVCFDEGFVGNPLVFCGSIGLLPVDRLAKEVRPGDLVVVVGGRTGRDGIHGATFSSQELTEESETASSGAVQIGNAIEEKRVMDALLAARDRGLYRGVTDCGAGGLSSAVGEMGADCGAHVVLDAVPLKYHGLTYREIWISEAQERMVLAVPPEHEAALLAVFAAEDVEATVIGRFDDSGRLTAEFRGVQVMDLPMGFLHDGCPRQLRPARRRRPDPGPRVDPDLRSLDLPATLLSLLSHPDVASKAWIVRQYDHEVQAGSVVKPLVGPRGEGPGDASVVAPVFGRRHGFAVGCGIAPSLGQIDPYRMALAVVDEALRNVVAVGGDPAQTSILDNFSWGNCAVPETLGDLVLACQGCYDAAKAYRTPFISGKDSLNNEYRAGGVSRPIPPTLLISALALVPDVARCTTMDLKAAGRELVLLGVTTGALGGSVLLRRLAAGSGAEAPLVDLRLAPRILAAVHAAIGAGLVSSVHDLSDGGLAVAAAEMALAGEIGAEIDVSAGPAAAGLPFERRLFAETPSRFLLEVAPGSLPALVRLLADLPHAGVGRTTERRSLVLTSGATRLVDLPLDRLTRAFLDPLDLDRDLGGRR